METIIARCCGLDVHKARLTACVRLLERGRVVELVESFATTTPDPLALRETGSGAWASPTLVAMESAGVCLLEVRLLYALEDDFESLLVNAQSTSSTCPAARPTRSTRRGDCEIAKLLAHGLL